MLATSPPTQVVIYLCPPVWRWIALPPNGDSTQLGASSNCRKTASTAPAAIPATAPATIPATIQSPNQHPTTSTNHQAHGGIFLPAEGKKPKVRNVAPTPTPTPSATEKPTPSKEFDPRYTASTPKHTLKAAPTLLARQLSSS